MPSSQEAFLDTEVREDSGCQHHWLIDTPAGPTSKGVCRLCGEEREFMNYIENYSWGGSDVSLDQISGGPRIPAGIDVSSAGEDSGLEDES